MKNKFLELGFSVHNTDFDKLEDTIKNRLNTTIYKGSIKKDLHKLTDVFKAGDIIKSNKLNHICIATDMDTDGITSNIVLTEGLKSLGYENITTLTNKRIHGNGFNNFFIDRILEIHKNNPIDLIIGADHGSVNDDAYKIFKNNGIKQIVITDHHTCLHGILKNADAFVNPLRKDSKFIKSISGCCVAYLTLLSMVDDETVLDFLLPFVSLSTIADVMDMSQPFNRHIVDLGLRELNSMRDKRWIYIKRYLDITGTVTYRDFGFKIAPLINSANATNTEEDMLELWLGGIEDFPNRLKNALEQNQTRKSTTRKLHDTYIRDVDTNNGITVVINSNLNVNGKVASSIGSVLNRPIIVFSDNGDTLLGSGRAILNSFNILECLHTINKKDKKIFIKYGGHKGALGCEIRKDRYDDFKVMFDDLCKEHLNTLEGLNVTEVDNYIDPNKMTTEIALWHDKYGPYGLNQLPPSYLTKVKVKGVIPILNFAKILFEVNNLKLTGTYFCDHRFNIQDIKQLYNKEIYIAFNMRYGAFRGTYGLELDILKIGDTS